MVGYWAAPKAASRVVNSVENLVATWVAQMADTLAVPTVDRSAENWAGLRVVSKESLRVETKVAPTAAPKSVYWVVPMVGQMVTSKAA